MAGWTDRHYRYLMRLITCKTTLYTEMVVDSTIINNLDHERFLGFNNIEHPVVVQIAGNDPEKMGKVANICEQFGYDEINLNIGCPSDKVQKGYFGLILMKEPKKVRDIAKSVRENTNLPVSIKCRIGVDDFNSYEYLVDFIGTVATSGVQHFIIHCRRGLLNLSAQQNRVIPKLDYDTIFHLIQDFPDLKFSINGGVDTLEKAKEFLDNNSKLEGVMIGRGAWNNPYMFHDADRLIFDSTNIGHSREEVLKLYLEYAEEMKLRRDYTNHALFKPILNLFHGQPNGNSFRKRISDNMNNRKLGLKEIVFT